MGEAVTGSSTAQPGDFDIFYPSQELQGAEAGSDQDDAGWLATWAVEFELRGGWSRDLECPEGATWAPFHALFVSSAESLGLGSRWVLHAASAALGLSEVGGERDEDRRAGVEAQIEEILSLLQPYPVLDPVRDLLQSVAGARSLADIRDPGGRLLRIVSQFAMLHRHGLDPSAALDALDQRYGRFGGRDIIEVLRVQVREQLLSGSSPGQGFPLGASASSAGVSVSTAPVGSVLLQPVETLDGQLLLAAGCALLPSLLERLQELVASGRIEDRLVVGSPSES